MNEKISPSASMLEGVSVGVGFHEQMKAPELVYDVVCYDREGKEKWRERVHNLVTTVGKNDLLDKYFAGSSYTATWYVGLISSVSYSALAAADMMSSHSGWTEAGPTNAPNYTQSNRPTLSWNAASSGSKAASAAAAFSITQTGTVKGAFVASNNTKDGTTGILYSESLFSADRSVANGDTINVTPTMSI